MTDKVLKLQQTLERLSNLLRAERRSFQTKWGLLPVQFEVLNYLASCNRFSGTLMAVCDYLGQTKGSVSQTIKLLEKRGLVLKQPDETDKRISRLTLSEEGAQIISEYNSSVMLLGLDEETTDKTQSAVDALLVHLEKNIKVKPFGFCENCQYNCVISDNEYYCKLVKTPLTPEDVVKVCVEYESKSQQREG
ncbi:MarR family transcriptional regulator [Veronia nyctiphanis]|uniref:MarR family transcriptional regulator n=1 Tax=Veronia nyctiphanis TaxID=1278244 RepID=A0A4Q0YPH1_9GAMM|nr:MarR family transcriptional regulator [Veronia nyctiphanis]RXJ72415.1 MarR family transcriptional regulator [Veronia nyctiphanis]